ncbi:uncharacterized protein GIQ15_01408 [Arthroderma uncinatum]|uniref:uncharacterized protein n=1 Tax=Arthroderma uncinatum TaxID=74035 RepID=UPI00144A4FD7|nr:uncharacterized protein GIQ15_01408 [Arthroderma uncinatum]KAF3491891.1 hypothetical protein GIQ15_01408 [Arthroderma uncinatum]
MFARIIKSLTAPRNPSVLLIISKRGDMIHALHLVPETGEIERSSFTDKYPTVQLHGSKETSREPIGTVTLPARGFEATSNFLEEVGTRIRKQWKRPLASSPSTVESVAQWAQDVLRPSALEVMHESEGKADATEETETLSVFLVYITRPKPGKVIKFTSL